jgi:small subunit ribosomal protein YMR-31
LAGAVESHDPQPHPQAPDHTLPTPVTDFKRYRANAIQHGPLARSGHFPSRQNGNSGNGASIWTAEGSSDAVLDRDELPSRFRRMVLTPAEMEAIDVCTSHDRADVQSGGATLVW